MAKMLSLLDVLPRHERVDIGSGKIDIFGISGEDLGSILNRYPDAFQQMKDSGSNPQRMKPGLLGALLAASQRDENMTSMLGDDQVEKIARSLSVSDQMKMLQAMGRCTFPEGVGPFLKGLVSLSSATNEVIQVVVQAVSKDRPTASQPTPKPSEQPATLASGS